MADITKCTNEDCPFKNYCYRHTAEDGFMQSWSNFEPDENGCDYFLEIRTFNQQ